MAMAMAMAQSSPVPIGLGFRNANLSIQSPVSSRRNVNLTRKSSRSPVIVCCAEKPQSRISRSTSTSTSGTSAVNDGDDERGNIILRAAWYGAEALGNIVSAFSPKNPAVTLSDASDASDAFQGPLARDFVVQAIKDDYEKGYFVTGWFCFLSVNSFGLLMFSMLWSICLSLPIRNGCRGSRGPTKIIKVL